MVDPSQVLSGDSSTLSAVDAPRLLTRTGSFESTATDPVTVQSAYPNQCQKIRLRYCTTRHLASKHTMSQSGACMDQSEADGRQRGSAYLSTASESTMATQSSSATVRRRRSSVDEESVNKTSRSKPSACRRSGTRRRRSWSSGSSSEPASEHLTDPRSPRTPRADERFIASRSPTKETMHLVAQAVGDPFGPAVRRSQRMAEQYATLRSPTAPVRSVGLQSTLVNARRNAMHRAASVGAVWSVGGTPVTEGIASTTNGRGGRVTSGTRAAHHQANFLRRNSRSEDERTHGHRLALAFDFDQSPRMVGNNSPSSSSSPPSLSLTSSPCSPLSDSPSTPSPTRTVWRDGRWQRNGTPTRMWKKLALGLPWLTLCLSVKAAAEETKGDTDNPFPRPRRTSSA